MPHRRPGRSSAFVVRRVVQVAALGLGIGALPPDAARAQRSASPACDLRTVQAAVTPGAPVSARLRSGRLIGRAGPVCVPGGDYFQTAVETDAIHRLVVGELMLVDVTVVSDAMHAAVRLVDSAGRLLVKQAAENWSPERGGTSRAGLRLALSRGTYYVIPELGPLAAVKPGPPAPAYQLMVTRVSPGRAVREGGPCEPSRSAALRAPLASGSRVQALLDRGSCFGADGAAQHWYQLRLPTRRVVEITLQGLPDGASAGLAVQGEDGDDPPGKPARDEPDVWRHELAAGTWYVGVSAGAQADRPLAELVRWTGVPYTLAVADIGTPSADAGDGGATCSPTPSRVSLVNGTAMLAGRFTDRSCVLELEGERFRAHTYEFTVTSPSRVQVRSDGLQGFLVESDGRLVFPRPDDDMFDSMDIRLRPGTFRLTVIGGGVAADASEPFEATLRITPLQGASERSAAPAPHEREQTATTAHARTHGPSTSAVIPQSMESAK